MRHLVISAMLLALPGCASAPTAVDWRAVKIVEGNEGQTGLALPTELPGCSEAILVRW